jgi:hypothetical protein
MHIRHYQDHQGNKLSHSSNTRHVPRIVLDIEDIKINKILSFPLGSSQSTVGNQTSK